MRKIGVGQRYKKTDPPSTVWGVVEPVLDPGGIRQCDPAETMATVSSPPSSEGSKC